MSTRANIIIKDQYSKLWFYRHSDGYPEGTMPELERFLSLVKDGFIRNNTGQAAGWLIILGAQEYDYKIDPTNGYKRKPTNSTLAKYLPDHLDKRDCWKVGAFEPTSGLHGDIEYLYVIDLDAKTITTATKDFETY